jgi:cell division protein FtsB
MAVFFCLVLVLVVQTIVLNYQTQTLRTLNATEAALNQEIRTNGEIQNWLDSDRYIEEYILNKLGLGRPGVSIFRR